MVSDEWPRAAGVGGASSDVEAAGERPEVIGIEDGSGEAADPLVVDGPVTLEPG